MTEFGAGKVWTRPADRIPQAPRTVGEGHQDGLVGLKKDEDIANVIAYLKDPAAGGQ